MTFNFIYLPHHNQNYALLYFIWIKLHSKLRHHYLIIEIGRLNELSLVITFHLNFMFQQSNFKQHFLHRYYQAKQMEYEYCQNTNDSFDYLSMNQYHLTQDSHLHQQLILLQHCDSLHFLKYSIHLYQGILIQVFETHERVLYHDHRRTHFLI